MNDKGQKESFVCKSYKSEVMHEWLKLWMVFKYVTYQQILRQSSGSLVVSTFCQIQVEE